MNPIRKAVALISGGLDSMLAARMMLEQGIHVEGLNFFTGFCVEGHTHAIRKHQQTKPKRNNALWVAETLGIKLHIIDVVEEYKDVVINPKHGYGQHLNPCLDCKIFMVKKAHEWRQEHDFDFIITGEVIGQRPMSQRKRTMPIVANQSGAKERLLRPLSALNLPETLPEQEGWVDRNKLLAITGRSRKEQFSLAEQLGITEYSQPAGGCCFLTNEHYSRKLADLWQAQGKREYDLDDVMLLKIGRHIRPKSHFKVIIGREEGENRYLEGYRRRFISLEPTSHDGPIALIDGNTTPEDIQEAARIAARYSQGRLDKKVIFSVRPAASKEGFELSVKPFLAEEIQAEWMV